SGQLGIEALSRGAKRCVFLDASREAICGMVWKILM
ncbi:RsmD family RNA methyltransferase, partial [Veillonella infantium]